MQEHIMFMACRTALLQENKWKDWEGKEDGACCWHGWKIKHSHSIATATSGYFITVSVQELFVHQNPSSTQMGETLKVSLVSKVRS